MLLTLDFLLQSCITVKTVGGMDIRSVSFGVT